MAQRQANPADASNTESVAERRRIPAGAPVLKLAAPEIPGYVLYWFSGKNVPKAIQGWYEHVHMDEIQLNQTGLGSDVSQEANTDLGSIVSHTAGNLDDNGKPERLYLMKIKKEYWLEDQANATGPKSRVGEIMRSLKGGTIGMEGRDPTDQQSVYVGKRSFVRNDPLAEIFNKEQ